MQFVVREPGGRAQFVKSARIMLMASAALAPQRSGVAAIDASLLAKAACVSSVLCLHQLDGMGHPYARISAHGSGLVSCEPTRCYRVLYDGIAKKRGCVSCVNVVGVCEVDAAATQEALVSVQA
jgi:hypothetical protein